MSWAVNFFLLIHTASEVVAVMVCAAQKILTSQVVLIGIALET
jgi:hypothetical protein